MDENKNVQITNEGVQIEIGTRDLLLRVLMQMGCQYTIDEDQRICFTYQGEHLWAVATNDCPYVEVVDAFWESCELSNVNRVSKLKQAINTINLRDTSNVFHTINNEDNMLWVHCKRNFLFIPQIPKIDEYLRSIFNGLFHSHYVLATEMERLEKGA